MLPRMGRLVWFERSLERTLPQLLLKSVLQSNRSYCQMLCSTFTGICVLHSALVNLEILSGRHNQIGLPWLVLWLTWNGFPSASGIFQGGERRGRLAFPSHKPPYQYHTHQGEEPVSGSMASDFIFNFEQSCHMNLNMRGLHVLTSLH